TGKAFVIKLEENLGRQINGIIANSTPPPADLLKTYHEQKSDVVSIDQKDTFWEHRETILTDILDTSADILRHDPKKLACIIQNIIGQTVLN
ncbi:MAG: hypothetical protein L3J69_17310, partial [Desulfobacula sp.]|nr:hypothetical protein [Desulfobacula sp.]